MQNSYFSTLGQLSAWIKELPGQIEGIPTTICQTGEPYVQFLEFALARPDDVGVIEAVVASRMGHQMQDYFRDKAGLIYWRTPLEVTIADHAAVVRFTEAGPDIDAPTNRRCVMDRNWKRVAAYCRLYRATLSFGEEYFDFAVTLKKPAEKAA